jgi:hypothetical protein
MRDFGLNQDQTVELMLEWNERTSPPWPEGLLCEKIANAYRYPQNEHPGALVDPPTDEIWPPTPADMQRREARASRYKLHAPAAFMLWPPPDFLVVDFIPRAGVSMLFGESGTYKTFIMLDAALAIASGRPFLGRIAVKHQGLAIYCAGEAPSGIALARVPAWLAHRGVSVEEVAATFRIVRAVPTLADPSGLVELADNIALEQGPVRLIVLDTAARMTGGEDENAAATGNRIIAMAEELRERFDCAVVFVDHAGKDVTRGARGSSAKKAGVDASFSVERIKDAGVIKIVCDKQKDADEAKPMFAKVVKMGGSLALDWIEPEAARELIDGAKDALEPKVRLALEAPDGNGVSTSQLALNIVALGLAASSEAISKQLRRAVQEGGRWYDHTVARYAKDEGTPTKADWFWRLPKSVD